MSISMRTKTGTIATPKKPGWHRKEYFSAWAFVAPALILLLIFLIIPFFESQREPAPARFEYCECLYSLWRHLAAEL